MRRYSALIERLDYYTYRYASITDMTAILNNINNNLACKIFKWEKIRILDRCDLKECVFVNLYTDHFITHIFIYFD